MNEYLGGGETLLLRLGSYLSKYTKVTIVTSKNSYISNNIDFECNILELPSYNYYYMNNREKAKYLENLYNFFKKSYNLKIVTFCFRELYTLVDLSKSLKFTPFHLLLHPLDHMYVGQSLFDKIILKTTGNQKFSQKQILEINKSILNNLNENNLVISMNQNISERVNKDFNIKINNLIALPVFDNNLKFIPKDHHFKKIVWIGRLVDFKLPSIYAMIDFLDKNNDYKFYIIGDGEEKKVKRYIDKKHNLKLKEQIIYLGKIKYSLLKDKLKEFDIGYAMGTSIIELSSMGLPTIAATASPNFEIFHDELCSGMCYELGYGDVGDDLYNPNITINNLGKISKYISKIQENYEDEARKSFQKTSDVFSIDKNSKLYQDFFSTISVHESLFKDINILSGDFFKKLALILKK